MASMSSVESGWPAPVDELARSISQDNFAWLRRLSSESSCETSSGDDGCPSFIALATPRRPAPSSYPHERKEAISGTLPDAVYCSTDNWFTHSHGLPRMWTRMPNDSTSRLQPVSPAPARSASVGPQLSSPVDGKKPRFLRHAKSAYLQPQSRPPYTRSGYNVATQAMFDGDRSSLLWPRDGPLSTIAQSKPSTPLDASSAPGLDYNGETDDAEREDLTDPLALTLIDPSLAVAGEAPPILGKKRSQLFTARLLTKKSLPNLRALV